jgi:glycosyltransferase involved in cell wall biosynthesis
MRISVAMCTYNGADFLPAQLESILAQSRRPDQIVICDDGSTDETRALLQKFEKQSPDVILLRFNKKNLGSIKNFEQAISLCNGEVIALSDQDDVWRHDKLQLLEENFKKQSTALVFSDAELVDENLTPLNRRMWNEVGFDEQKKKLLRSGRALEVLVTGWTVTGATMAFRAGFKNICLPVPEGIAMIHDGWIALTIAAVAEVVALDEPMIQYRQHDRQQIGAPERVEEGPEPRGLQKFETAFKRRNSSADLYKILETLEERLVAFTGFYDTQKALTFVGDYSFHLNARANLQQRRRINRVPGILRELLSLRYHEYGNGFKSAAKDLVS